MKVGDLVRVDFTATEDDCYDYKWTGICIWHDGHRGAPYKFEFLINGKTEIWNRNDLEFVGATVISKAK